VALAVLGRTDEAECIKNVFSVYVLAVPAFLEKASKTRKLLCLCCEYSKIVPLDLFRNLVEY